MLGDEVWLIEPVGVVAPAITEVAELASVAAAPASGAPAKGALVPA